jgi:hypothetical protein
MLHAPTALVDSKPAEVPYRAVPDFNVGSIPELSLPEPLPGPYSVKPIRSMVTSSAFTTMAELVVEVWVRLFVR